MTSDLEDHGPIVNSERACHEQEGQRGRNRHRQEQRLDIFICREYTPGRTVAAHTRRSTTMLRTMKPETKALPPAS